MGKCVKRHLALLLCLMLCLSLFPAAAFAEGGETTANEITGGEPIPAERPEETAEADVVEEEAAVTAETEGVIPSEAEDVIPEEEETDLVIEEETESLQHDSIPGLPKLAAPSNLHWDSDYPGVFVVTINQPFQNAMCCALYRLGQNEPVYETHFNLSGYPLDQGVWRTDLFTQFLEEGGSGDYYVAVYAVGDGISYSDSDKVESAVWHYEKPSVSLPKMAKPVLNGIAATYVVPEGIEHANGIQMDIRFAKTADEEPHFAGSTWKPIYYDSTEAGEVTWDIYDICLEQNGPGYYSVRFRLLSGDITVFNNGTWSDWSEPSNVTEIQTGVRAQLQQIAANADSRSDDEIRSDVQALDSEKLKTAMLTDQDNSGPVAAMAALDEKLGGTPITVAPEMNGSFGADEISVVGAQLNTPQAAGKPIGFVLEKPKYNDVVPAMYNSSIAVRFSMDLENTNTSGMLAVPVKVTLPIPAGINPSFLAVLHYHTAGGEPEAIHPYVFQENGKYYASFVLSSFSDFVFTETLNDSDEAVAGFVRRGYSLMLGREADADGLKFYVDLLTSGQLSGAQMVSNFMYSPEFSDKNYPSEQVVRIVYQTMLNREPDADGLRYHSANLDRGISYNSLINNFSGSEEFAGICGQSGITPGMVEPEWRERNPGVTAFVARNYELTLGRVAGGSELNYYCQILLEKTLTPQQVAHNFVFSPECRDRGLSDRAFIEMLYHLYMDRDADAGGLNYYLNALNSGTTREAVDAGFGNSPEFQTIVQSYGL